MPKICLLILLFLCFSPRGSGQNLPTKHIPSSLRELSHINLSEILFSPGDLKKLNCKVVRGRMAFSDLQNRVTDTSCLFEFRFNDDFQCTHKTFWDRNSVTTIDFQRFPQDGILIESMKDSIFNGKLKGLFAEFERHYKNDLLQKNMEINYFLDHPGKYLGHEDTLIYNSDNQVITKIEKYYELQSGLPADSLIEQRNYDKKGRLIQLTRLPSKTFFQKNTGHGDCITEGFITQICYRYNNATDSCYVEFYDPLKPSTDTPQYSYGVKMVYTEPNKTMYKYCFEQGTYVYQEIRSKNEKYEQNGEDKRTTIFVEGTDLPLLIKQPDNKRVLFYEFKYEK